MKCPSVWCPGYSATYYRSATTSKRPEEPRYGPGSAEADPEDVVLLEDLLGMRDAAVASPNVSAEARRRRLAGLIGTPRMSPDQPTVYVVEDVHWIDAASEAMLADLLTNVSRTQAMVVITYRPEYAGLLLHVPGIRGIKLSRLMIQRHGK